MLVLYAIQLQVIHTMTQQWKKSTKIKDIKVGKRPVAVGSYGRSSTSYVANGGDGTVSVIDEDTNEEVAKVSFNVEPFNAGHIEYNRLIAPVVQQFYLWSGSKCTAKPHNLPAYEGN